MTREELEKEAEDNKPPYAFCALDTNCELWKDGYKKGAEPREKRIAELEAQIEKMKYLLNEIYSEFGFSELVKIRNNLPIEIQEVIKEIKEK